MTNIQFGLMIRGQFPQGDDLGVRFEEMIEQVRLVDRLGFASLTKGMHYATHPLQSFNQLVWHSRMAAESRNLRLNFGIILLALHKPLDALSITSLMAAAGWPRRWRHAVNAAFAILCPLGAVLFLVGIDLIEGYQREIVASALAFAAGVFVCIALGDLLPEMEFHSHSRVPLTAALLSGIALAWAITFLEPAHLH